MQKKSKGKKDKKINAIKNRQKEENTDTKIKEKKAKRDKKR